MVTIKLQDYYYWYPPDEFLAVPDDVAAELLAGKRYEWAYQRRRFRHKAHFSLDAEDGIETAAITCHNDSPERIVVDLMERHCSLCCALNSLPEIQGRRVEAHYLLGMSQKEIAEAEGVSKEAVSKSIEKGVAAMKKYLRKF
jgi:RNA polymerase sigma-70 factor (ECF subfamily)